MTLLCSLFHGNFSHTFLPLSQGDVVQLPQVYSKTQLPSWSTQTSFLKICAETETHIFKAKQKDKAHCSCFPQFYSIFSNLWQHHFFALCDHMCMMGLLLPSDSTSLSGSTPGERMKNTGDAGPLSLKDLANSDFRPSVYVTPSFSSTKFLEYIKIKGEHKALVV